MKVFSWNSEKNEILINERNISFEDIIVNINLGNELDIYDHPNQQKYPKQKVSVVQVEDYVYLVPYIENDEEIFLKTIIPSKKATKQYIGGKK